jgi:hypothetical protein
MTKAQQLYSKINNKPFSYGESVSMILEEQGKPVSALPNEDFVFPDNSVIRVSNNGVSLLEFLVE